MKRAIKILLALAVMVTTFVVITVVASASDYVYVDREGAADYAYIPGMTYQVNWYYPDYHDNPSVSAQVYFMEYGTHFYKDYLFESLAGVDLANSISLCPFGSDENSMEDFWLYPGDVNGVEIDSYYSIHFVFYSSGDYFDMWSIFTVACVVYVDKLPVASSPGSSGSGSSGSGSSSASSSGRFKCSDGKEFVYDSELLSHCRFGGYPTASYLPVFFVTQGLQYENIFIEFWSRMDKSLNGYHYVSDFEWDPLMEYKVYTLVNGEVSKVSSGDVYGGLQLSSGTYIVKFSFYCGCTSCSDYDVSAGYAEFACFVYAVDTLPEVVPASGFGSGNSSGTYTSGYNNGYSDGYSAGHSTGFAKGEAFSYNEGYSFGYDIGYDDGFSGGWDNGYYKGKDVGFDEGYDFAYDLGVDSGYDLGYDLGFTVGYRDGSSDGYDKGFDDAATVYEGEGSARYQQGYQDALKSVIDTDGDAISGFFTGISGSTITALDYITKNVRIGSSTLFDIVEFVLFVVFCYFVVKLLIKIFTK